jgi:hypothetical protein
MILRPTPAVIALLCAVPIVASAEEAKDIAQRALDNSMFSSENAQATIDLDVYKDGKPVRQRKISAFVKRKDGRVRSFVEFQAPADVAGTKFLSLEEEGETRQFIYLPAFKKVKRIVGAQRSQSFMGTDFSYSDLEGRDVEDWKWKMLPDEPIQGQAAHVIEGVPSKVDDAQYGRMVIWVHKTHGIPLKTEFYDVTGKELVKKLEVQKLGKKDDRWITLDSVMQTPKKGTETRLKVVAIDLKSTIPDEKLTREALEH